MKTTLIRTSRLRVQWTSNWRSKPQPWFFRATYPTRGGRRSGTLHLTGLEVWW